jgi:hypothetical protein
MLLREAFRPHLGWDGARLVFMSAFPITLFQIKTVVISSLILNSMMILLQGS